MRKSVLTLAAAAVAASAAAGIAYASIPDGGGVIHGCYQKNAGSLRVIDSPTDSCRSGEVALNWSQTGPAGARGATGPSGADGAPGPAGPTGPSGAWTFQAGRAGNRIGNPTTWNLFHVPAGNLFVEGTVKITGEAGGAECVLLSPASQLVDDVSFIVPEGQPVTIALQGAVPDAPAGVWRISCSSPVAEAFVDEIRAVALEVGNVH